jgi:hypothetical protein
LDLDATSLEPTPISTSALETLARQQHTPPPREKRRYRRHPRVDPNAPKKPKTACTLLVYSIPDINASNKSQMSTSLTSYVLIPKSANLPLYTSPEKLAEDGKNFLQSRSGCGRVMLHEPRRSTSLRWTSIRRLVTGGSTKYT